MTCAVVGDSIAQGVAPHFVECSALTKIGIGSLAILHRVSTGYSVVVVSAGTNDWSNPHLLANLRAIRARAATKVIWILPVNDIARKAVQQAAADNRDPMVAFAPGRDHVHPRSYSDLAKAIRSVL